MSESSHKFLVGILTFLVFLAFRATMPFIADEDLMLASIITEKTSISEAFSVGGFTEFKGIPVVFGNNLIEFRPLSIFFSNNMAYFFSVNEKMAFVFALLFLGSLVGVMSAVLFEISFRITKNIYAAYGAVLVNLFSSIFLVGSFLYLFAIPYILPHFCNVLAFFFYLRYLENNSQKNLLGLSLFCLVGPLFREAGLIAPLSILLCEIFRHASYIFKKSATRPSLKSGALFLLLFLHSIAPQTIFYLSGIYDGKFTTIFGGEKLIGANAGLALNLNRFTQILLELPSSLWIVFLFGLSLLISKRKFIPIFLFFLSIFFYSFFNTYAAFFLFGLIFLTSFVAINPYLTVLATVSLVPALFLLSNHLIADIFFITPFAVIFSAGVYAAWRKARAVVFVVLIISLFDLAANCFSSYSATVSINKKHQEIALMMKDEIPNDSLVVTNFFAGRDIVTKHDKYKAAGELNFYLYDRNNQLFSYVNYKDKKGEMLRKLRSDIFEKQKNKDVYFLLIKSRNADYHLYLPHEKMENLQSYEVHNSTLHLDPLRYFILNRKFITNLNSLPENRTFPQYDTSYDSHSANNCCISNSKIGLYKLSHKLFFSLTEEDFEFERLEN